MPRGYCWICFQVTSFFQSPFILNVRTESPQQHVKGAVKLHRIAACCKEGVWEITNP